MHKKIVNFKRKSQMRNIADKGVKRESQMRNNANKC